MAGVSEKAVPATAEADQQLHERCVKMKDHTLRRYPKATYLMDAIQKLGCELPEDFIKCMPCESFGQKRTGGFVPPGCDEVERGDNGKPLVVMCEDQMYNQRMCDTTLTHELVHAFDQCRAKASFEKNCLHQACSEVRASNMSGECAWSQEILRGNYAIQKQHQACVKRRANLSLQGSPLCAAKASEFVDAAFDACYNDPSPFYGSNCY